MYYAVENGVVSTGGEKTSSQYGLEGVTPQGAEGRDCRNSVGTGEGPTDVAVAEATLEMAEAAAGGVSTDKVITG